MQCLNKLKCIKHEETIQTIYVPAFNNYLFSVFLRKIRLYSECNATLFRGTRTFAALRRAKCSAPIKYYDHHVALYHLPISSADAELNPGPAPRCQKTLQNSKT